MNRATNVCAATPSQNSPNYLKVKAPTRLLKRLLKSFSKTALKLASNLSPRSCFDDAANSTLSLHSPPPQSSCEARERMVEELREVFKNMDADGDGKISWVDLQSALNSCVGEEEEELVEENEAREMIKELDIISEGDGDGCIHFDGFVRLINCEERREEEVEKDMAAAFKMFQGSSAEGITPAGLQRMMRRLGVESCVSLDQCSFIISQVDLDGDGVVSFTEFKHMMTAAVH